MGTRAIVIQHLLGLSKALRPHLALSEGQGWRHCVGQETVLPRLSIQRRGALAHSGFFSGPPCPPLCRACPPRPALQAYKKIAEEVRPYIADTVHQINEWWVGRGGSPVLVPVAHVCASVFYVLAFCPSSQPWHSLSMCVGHGQLERAAPLQ